MNKLYRKISVLRSSYQENGIYYVLKKVFIKIFSATGLSSYFSFSLDGYKLYLHPTLLTHNLFADCHYRVADENILKKFLSKGDTVVDVGANIGSLTLAMSTQVGPEGKVLSFEPSPKMFEYLTRNVVLNKRANIKLFNCALGQVRTSFYLNETRKDDTTYRVEESQVSKEYIAVDVMPLDEYTKDIQKIDLLKIDVEGYELAVLEGAAETLKKTKVLYIEFITDNLLELGTNPSDVVKKLEEEFDLYILEGKNVKNFKFEVNKEYRLDLICLPKRNVSYYGQIYFKPMPRLTVKDIENIYEKSTQYYNASISEESVRVPRPLFWNEIGIGYEYLSISKNLADSLYVGERWDPKLFEEIGKGLGTLHSSLGLINDDIYIHGDFLPHNIAELDDELIFFDFDPPLNQGILDSLYGSRYTDIASFIFGLWISHPFKQPWLLWKDNSIYIKEFLNGYENAAHINLSRETIEKYLKLEFSRWYRWYVSEKGGLTPKLRLKYALIYSAWWSQRKIHRTFD